MNMAAGREHTCYLVRTAFSSNGRFEGILKSGCSTQTGDICEGAATTSRSDSADECGGLGTVQY